MQPLILIKSKIRRDLKYVLCYGLDDRSTLKVGLIIPKLLALKASRLGNSTEFLVIQVLAYHQYWKTVFPTSPLLRSKPVIFVPSRVVKENHYTSLL